MVGAPISREVIAKLGTTWEQFVWQTFHNFYEKYSVTIFGVWSLKKLEILLSYAQYHTSNEAIWKYKPRVSNTLMNQNKFNAMISFKSEI